MAMVAWFARLAPKLIQFKPDVLIATANQNYWFLLSYLDGLAYRSFRHFTASCGRNLHRSGAAGALC